MSDFGDYLYEMDEIRTSAAEIERLLSGSPDVGYHLEPLVGLFAALRTDADAELADETVAAYVAAATAASVEAQPLSPAGARPPRRPLFNALRRRIATATVAATVLLGGTSGLAVAADGAKPGDTLYGIDRAFEAIGIGAGAEQERMTEAEALIDGGAIGLGLEHAAEALEDADSDSAGAAQALKDAADRVRAGGTDQSAATREQVAGLLSYLADNVGAVDGQRVAELAVEIGGPKDRPAGPPVGVPAGPPERTPADPPGLSDREPGPPGDKPTNPPGLTDKDPGPPDHVTTGPPEHSNANTTKPPKDKP